MSDTVTSAAAASDVVTTPDVGMDTAAKASVMGRVVAAMDKVHASIKHDQEAIVQFLKSHL